MRGPVVTRRIKIGDVTIGVVAWWEKREKKAGRVCLSVWRNGEPAQSIVADHSDAPLQNKNAHQGKLAKIAFTISAEEQARRTADAFHPPPWTNTAERANRTLSGLSRRVLSP